MTKKSRHHDRLIHVLLQDIHRPKDHNAKIRAIVDKAFPARSYVRWLSAAAVLLVCVSALIFILSREPHQPPKETEPSQQAAHWIEQGNFAKAAEWIEKIEDAKSRTKARSDLATRWGDRAPKEAVDWAEAISSPDDRNNSLETIFSIWAKRDYKAAMARAVHIQNRETRAAVLARIKPHAPSKIPGRESGSVGIAENLNPPTTMAAIEEVRKKAAEMANRDPEKAVAWAESLQNQRAKFEAEIVIGKIWIQKDFDKAVDWAVTGKSSGRVYGVFSVWAEIAPDTVAEGVAKIQDVNLTKSAQIAVVKTWAVQRPQLAAELLAKLETSDFHFKSRLHTDLAWEWASKDPPAAAAWAGSVKDPSCRSAAMNRVARRWVKEDPAAARKWAAGLDEADRRKLSRILGLFPKPPQD